MSWIVEPAVLSNERLYLQDGGEPIIWMVVNDETNDVHSVHLHHNEAQAALTEEWGT